MASENYIIRQIEDITAGKCTEWQIGLTNEPLSYKAQLGNPLTWLHWKADSEQEARDTERFFFRQRFERHPWNHHWTGCLCLYFASEVIDRMSKTSFFKQIIFCKS